MGLRQMARDFVDELGYMAASSALHSWDAHLKLALKSYDRISRRCLMAMLVHCTYFRDLNLIERFGALLMEYDNKRAEDYGDTHWEPYLCRATLANELYLKDLGLAFYRRRPSHRNRKAPGLAIVLRGTIPTRSMDLLDDLRIGMHALNQSDRVLDTVRLIVQVVKSFQTRYPNESICMAGHSLGAAIGLIVGGTLYSTYGINIDTRLFNPPLVTVVNVLSGRVRPTAPADFYGDNHVPELEVDFGELKRVFVQSYGNQAAMNDEWAQFEKLRDWVPHLYLNPGDPFCFRYIEFYKAQQGQPFITPEGVMSSQGVLSGLFHQNATLFKNVVPSADLHISNWQSHGNWPSYSNSEWNVTLQSQRLSHSLRQWHKYKREYIELQPVYCARLLPSPSPRRHRQDRHQTPHMSLPSRSPRRHRQDRHQTPHRSRPRGDY
ncbi:hypothetical protein M758_1G301300 [Ceratodon purpureus]|nr:hypothetical protein M758_1G301300 [Ceratodon purpureus]